MGMTKRCVILGILLLLVSCMFMEPEPWDPNIAYRRGERVETHPNAYVYAYYESMRDQNIGHDPDHSPGWWEGR